MRDIETGYRGYLITNDQVFLEPYYKGKANIDENIDKLNNLIQDNPEQIKNIEILKINIHKKMDIVNDAIKAKQSGDDSAHYLKPGKQAMDQVRAIIAKMHAEEDFLLNIRVLKMSYIFKWMIVNTTIFVVVGICFIVGANTSYLNDLWRPKDLERKFPEI